ncbi:MAG: hypothetical protein GWN62_13895, partial [Aliifodinibius sp.]|nr:hypothetical protein [Fodinibius sp.]
MRSDLTEQQSNILDADVKHVSWLFEVDVGNTGSVDYYWSTKAKTWGGQSYTFKIMDFSSLKIILPSVEENLMQKNEIDVKVSFK